MEFLKRLNEDTEQFVRDHSMPFLHTRTTLKEYNVEPSLEEMY
jgi:hypothetical protein